MLKSATIITLIFLYSLTLIAQDLSSKRVSGLANLIIKPLRSNIKANGLIPYGIQSLHFTLPSDGSSSTSAVTPVGTYRYEREVYLITPAEMATVGIPGGINFTDIAWTYNTTGSAAVTGSLKIYLQNTSDITNQKGTTWSADISTMTLVDNNSSFTNPIAYYFVETLSNPSGFTYTGGGLYIAFDYSNPSNSLSTGTTVNTTNTLSNGSVAGQSNTSSSPILGNSNSRPETYLGYTIANDAQIIQVYTLGKLPIPYGTPHKVAAVIQNGGDNDLTNLKVKLNITGANTFSDSIMIATLLSGYDQSITFSSWTPTAAGIDTIKVFVPPDLINSNNSITVIQITTPNTYSYAYGPFPATSDGSGVGLTGVTGDFVAKFRTSSSASISQVGTNFAISGQPFKIGIWDATGTGGTPGTLLWQSGSLTSTTGMSTIPVNPKVNVSGNFYVGVIQTGTTSVAFAYQSEDPIRDSTFYFTSPTGSSNWTDFAATSNTFRLMIEPGLTLANDVGPSTMDFPQGGSYNNITANVAPKVTIANFGSNNQSSSFSTTMKIYNASNSLVYTSTKSLTLNAGATNQISFDATFNPTAQLYTAKCYTSLGTDADKNNDTLTISFNYSQFSLNLTAFLEGYTNTTSGTVMDVAPSAVKVVLHNSTPPYAGVDSVTSSLSTAGVGTFTFTNTVDGTPYYIVVKTWNTIETWSKTTQTFSGGSLSYDFTSAQSQAYGNNLKQVVSGAKWCIYSGDVDQDHYVGTSDLIAVNNDSYNLVRGYFVTDVTGDLFTSISDLIIVNNNSYNLVRAHTPLFLPGTTRIINGINKQPKIGK